MKSSESQTTAGIALRPALVEDFDYCARLYIAEMEATIRQLNLDREAHVRNFRPRWIVSEVRIITRDGGDLGWLQSATMPDALFLVQFFVDAPIRNHGIGTEVMRRLIAEAGRAGLDVTLGVVKSNPALRLYERLGFKTTHEDDRKFYMRRMPDAGVVRS